MGQFEQKSVIRKLRSSSLDVALAAVERDKRLYHVVLMKIAVENSP